MFRRRPREHHVRMRRARFPWRTGEDTRERVLEWVLQEAMTRPEIADELTISDASAAVRDAAQSIFSGAGWAEGIYRSWSLRVRSVRSLIVTAALTFPILLGAVFFGANFGVEVDWWFVPLILILTAILVGRTVDSFNKRPKALSAFEEWWTTLLRDSVLPVLFAKINETAKRTYSTTLTVHEARALNRANLLSMHVSTPASRELARLVDQFGGGSFALAGPRGAGKSNLLNAFCGGRYRNGNRQPDLAVLVSAPVEYVPHEFVVHLFAATCRGVINYPWSSSKQLAAAARANLALLSYVPRYTREVKVKGGARAFEVGRRRGMSLQGRALTYPEVVEKFREFMRDAVAALQAEPDREPGRVIIGIDELDRLGTGEPAHRFLTELKAIFDVTGCYYLVSVSTEAQHDFDMSGMGRRSVFDSSFDEVVRVDYLDFDHAKRLLRRYVIGLSEQFLALAYVFSGGLARQLVRVARAIIEFGRTHPDAELTEVVAELVTVELVRTCQATSDGLGVADDRGGVGELLRVLDDPPRKPAGGELRAFTRQVLAAYTGDSERVTELRNVVAARVYFLATVLDVFTEELTEQCMTGSDFDMLARARRYLGVNPTTGVELVNRFAGTRLREEHGS
jgi:hypothetical protein